jgi:hypothetical protein
VHWIFLCFSFRSLFSSTPTLRRAGNPRKIRYCFHLPLVDRSFAYATVYIMGGFFSGGGRVGRNSVFVLLTHKHICTQSRIFFFTFFLYFFLLLFFFLFRLFIISFETIALPFVLYIRCNHNAGKQLVCLAFRIG